MYSGVVVSSDVIKGRHVRKKKTTHFLRSAASAVYESGAMVVGNSVKGGSILIKRGMLRSVWLCVGGNVWPVSVQMILGLGLHTLPLEVTVVRFFCGYSSSSFSLKPASSSFSL